MAGILDVAKLADVSPTTVSRVVNDNGYVSEETRRRVNAAILELDYIPNELGKSLRSKRTQTLALVLSDMTNPFWTTVARGVEDTANKRGYHVIIGNTDESPEKQEEYLHFLMKKQVDGFLLVPASFQSPHILKPKTPTVILDRRVLQSGIDSVRCDSVAGANGLVKTLLEFGHRLIAIITGRDNISTAIDRVEGAVNAFSEAGLTETPQIYWGEYSQQSGYDNTVKALLAIARPSAIFATNNFIAIGVMRALRDAGLRVPNDMSVVAFDDLPASITIDPFFTVAAQPAYEMGRIATELLLSRLMGEGSLESQEIVLPVEIIVRGSSGKPPVF